MNKYELVYDLKEHLDAYSQTYDDYIMSYGEVDMIYHYIEEKDKEIERLNNVVNELFDEKEKLLKYKRFIYNIIITPVDWKNPYHYQLHNFTKQELYGYLYNLRKEIIDELKGSNKSENMEISSN